jgi:hypothetical protein
MMTNAAGGWLWNSSGGQSFIGGMMNFENIVLNWLGSMQAVTGRLNYTIGAIANEFMAVRSEFFSIAENVLSGNSNQYPTWFTWGNPGHFGVETFTNAAIQDLFPASIGVLDIQIIYRLPGEGETPDQQAINAFYIFNADQIDFWKGYDPDGERE